MATQIPSTDERGTYEVPPINRLFSDAEIGDAERWASAFAGGLLLALGLKHRSLGGALLVLGGGTLLHRAATGHWRALETLGLNRSTKSGVASVRHGQGIKVEKNITINKSPAELYRFWRNFENLPRFMRHLESVRVIDDQRSHWVVKGPAGTTVEWGAEIYNERPDELIAWRSLQNADVNNAGSVHFESMPDGRGTQVKVVLSYEPPAGQIGSVIAKLLGEEPEQKIQEDLQRFKQLMETSEISATAGQSAG